VLPETLGFAEGSLLPGADIARQPGDWVCLGAVLLTSATVTAALAGQIYTLLPQGDRADLPPNSAVLTDQPSPSPPLAPALRKLLMAEAPGDLGKPT
jgi:N-acetylmuramoyl-L-alanine amidase